VSIS
jgi:hypothetical protein